VVSFGNKPFSSQWCTPWSMRINGSLTVLSRSGSPIRCGEAYRHGSRSPSMMARRG
jgi:hypothetical protein